MNSSFQFEPNSAFIYLELRSKKAVKGERAPIIIIATAHPPVYTFQSISFSPAMLQRARLRLLLIPQQFEVVKQKFNELIWLRCTLESSMLFKLKYKKKL